MTVTPIFDDLTAYGGAEEFPEDATAFGQGCLEDNGVPGDTVEDVDVATAPDDTLAVVLDAARREVGVLGHGRVGTEHLLLAVVRAGGEVGRAFGLRRAGSVVDLAPGLLAGRSATLLATLGVDRHDLADVLAREDLELPAAAPVRADVRPPVAPPVPVGTVGPVALMLPSAPQVPAGAEPVPDATAPLWIGPPPGSPARRVPPERLDLRA